MILSILIPTLPEREQSLARLMSILNPQLTDQVEVLTDPRPRGHVTTGEKRNYLLSIAKGTYSVFVDDDDWIAKTYIQDILFAIESNPDCVTFEGWYTENGRNRVNWVIKLGEAYESRKKDGIEVYYRWPNHLAVIKTELSRMVKFPNVTIGEDYRWSKEMNDRGILKTGVHIEKHLYHYDYRANK